MKSRIFLLSSGLGLAALLGMPAAAQPASPAATPGPAVAGGQLDANSMDANSMPADRSTPQEHAQTAGLNNQESASTGQADSQAASADAQYQAQRKEYQEQLRQNQKAQADYQNQKAAYDARTARYESLRARFAAERAQYHRDLWPYDYRPWELRPDYQLMHAKVEITNGDHVGTVTAIARDPFGRAEGLEVSLDDGKLVWIDASDARFNRPQDILMTDLDRDDLREMADERL